MRATFGSGRSSWGDRLGQAGPGLRARLGGEDRPDQRAEQSVLVPARVAEAFLQEVDRAALPGAAEHLRERRLQPRMGVRDRELHPAQPTLDQRMQELAPERLGLRLADVEADDLPATGLVHRVRDHHALRHHPTALQHLFDLGVDEQVRVATSSGRSRKASTCSSSSAAMRLTSDLEMRSPSDSTS